MPVTRIWVLAFLFFSQTLAAQERPGFRLLIDPAVVSQGQIQIVFFGGDDCPICRSWLAQERPQWLASSAAKSVHLVVIDKSIKSRLAQITSWPSSIGNPLRAQLINASSQRAGSPFLALIVNDQLIDFFFGAPSAAFLGTLVEGVRGNVPYPTQPCLQLGRKFADECAVFGPAELTN
jgi:hypothetical protein